MSVEGPNLARTIVLRSMRFVSLRVLSGGLSVVASLFLYRALGPEEAGRFQFVLALGMTLGVLCGLGRMETLARFVPGANDSHGPGMFRGAARSVLGFGMVLGAALWLIFSQSGISADAAQAGVFLSVFVLVYGLYTVVLGMLRGQGRLEALPLLDLGWSFGAKLMAILAVLSAPAFLPAFAAYTGTAFLVLIAAVLTLRLAPWGAAVPWDSHAARFAKLILLAEMVRILSRTVDVYVVRGLLGPEATGLFAAGVRVTAVVEQLVLTPIGVPLLYYFSHPASSALRRQVVENGGRVLGAVMGAGALALSASSELVVTAFLGEAYRDSVPVARLYAGHAVGMALLTLLIPLYNSKDKPQFTMAQAGALLVLTLGLDLVLIPRYGVLGAAAGGVVGIALTAFAASWVVRRQFEVDIRSVVLRVVLLYAGCFAMVAAGWWIAAFAVYGFGVWFLKLIRPGDAELFKRPKG